MILPPFQGISSKYDEAEIREAIISFLSPDVVTFTAASKAANVTYLIPDVVTFQTPTASPSVTYLAADVVSLGALSDVATVTYESIDVLTYDPPPEVPEITRFLSHTIEDSRIDLNWNIPWERRSPLLNYVLEYTDCFLSTILTEDNLQLIEESYYLLTHDNNIITNENDESLAPEPDFALITDNYRSNCNYQQYDHRRILEEDKDRIIGDTFLLTEKSSGVGLINSVNVNDLSNGQSYIFRIAAVNSVGTGEYGYTNILTPIGAEPVKYCDLSLFLQPNSLGFVQTSLTDYSCREKDVIAFEGVTVSSDSQFGAGSLAFDGVYHSLPTPGTRSHLQVAHNSDTTGENWSLSGDFNIEMWIKPDQANGGTQSLISAHNPYVEYFGGGVNDDESDPSRWNLYREGLKIKFQMLGRLPNGGGTSTTLTTDDITLSTTEFSHIAVSRFQDRVRLYVNGQQKDKQTVLQNVATSGQYLVIGAEQRADYESSDTFNTGRGVVYNPFKGNIDDVMIFNKARYTRNFTPQKYSETADCAGCGGYSVGATSASVSSEFIP